MGVVYNPTYGGQYGGIYGPGADEFVPVPGVTYDAASRKGVPASLAEWNLALTAAGFAAPPSLLWKHQEAAGNAADSINAFVGTATGGVTYNQPVSGWTRTGMRITQLSSDTISNIDAGLPDISASSMLIFAYVGLGAGVGTAREYLSAGTTVKGQALAWPNLRNRASSNVNVANGAQEEATSAGHLMILQVDRTNSVLRVYNELEVITPTWDATMTGRSILLGSSAVTNAAAGIYMYTTMFAGVNANWTVAQTRSLIRALGWAPSW